jgi:2-dehydro-3-deoxyphosphogalactonate aldolase
MKITGVKSYAVGVPGPPRGSGNNWVFLKLLTDEGIEGLGDASWVPFEPRITALMIEDVFEEFVEGIDPFDTEKLWQLLYCGRNSEHPDLTRDVLIGAFEMACWDIKGKALSQPIYNLLGGKFHEKLRAYSYLNPKDPDVSSHDLQRNPELAAEAAIDFVERGFTAFKIDPVQWAVGLGTLGPRELSLETLRAAEAVIRSIREAVGDRCDIGIGTHGQMTTHSSISLAKRLEQYHPLWYEEPIRGENRDEMAIVARSTTIPVGTGERLSTKWEFGELLEKKAASILQFGLDRVGGIMEAKKIAGMAEVHYAQIAPWGATGPVTAAAAVQLDVCTPNFLIQEGPGDWSGFRAEVLKEPIKWEKGYLIPPTKPGLGIELDEEVIAKNPPHSRKAIADRWKRIDGRL